MFEAVRRWHAGLARRRVAGAAAPWRRPASIIPTHRRRSPASPTTWPGAPRAGPAMPPRIAFLIPRGAIADAQTGAIDELLRRSERHGQAPLAVWFDDSDPEALRKSFAGADVQALVNLQHLQNGPARRAEFLALDVPVLQTLGYRDGNEADWLAAASGWRRVPRRPSSACRKPGE
ncbi:cobaltochelatase subunit CobN [Pseudomonas aeruginosa]|nr:cobaltochelatase subunit CobN [Pseudomonas aeruginosa]